MKNVAFVLLLSLCSATMACKERDPFSTETGRFVEPRLSHGEWRKCCAAPQKRTSCDEALPNRDAALALLVVAESPACIDKALAAVEKHAEDDLAAAYFIRAKRLGDPVDYLRALQVAHDGFNRALIQETLGLTKEAIRSYDDLWKTERSDWSREARDRRDRLLALHDPLDQPPYDMLADALQQRDRGKLAQIARMYPTPAAAYFEEEVDLLDVEAGRLLADVLEQNGDPHPRAILDAVERTRDRDALEEGIRTFRKAWDLELSLSYAQAIRTYERAAALLERAGNPLHLSARYRSAQWAFMTGEDSLPRLDALAPAVKSYPRLATRLEISRARALEDRSNYIGALRAYDHALLLAKGDMPMHVAALARRSINYTTIGHGELAFREAFRALTSLSQVADVNGRHQTYSAASMAARKLGHPLIALQFQNAAVDAIQATIARWPPKALPRLKQHFAVVLRARADLHIELGLDADAQEDLQRAADLAESLGNDELRAQLRMRVEEVRGQALLNENPAEAVRRFTRAIELASKQDSTYRAVLHFKRAAARRNANDPRADDDFAAALEILRGEATFLLDPAVRGRYEALWTPYFSRFQAMYHDIIERSIAQKDVEGAFLYAEQARGFEPMQMLLQSHVAPPGFRKLETKEDLLQQLGRLGNDTAILQFLVLKNKTYTWVLTRGKIQLVAQRAGREDIEGWVRDVRIAVQSRQRELHRPMRAAYAELFREPLRIAGAGKTRFVIVPDGPMHALPFAGLQGTRETGYLIQQGSIAVAGSTSLYFYALARDRQLSLGRPDVLIVGDPNLDPGAGLDPLPHSREEARQLARDYANAKLLIGGDATIDAFLDAAKSADIIHFAGHAVPNAQRPWLSMLLLAPQGDDSGQLTAERLMFGLAELERTRLVVLGACSSAGGQPIGPEGVAPLVRPLIAANVPAVVGTLWDVRDATAKDLLVSFHCHYRNGDDVAVALRHAQLEMLRNNEPAMSWAQFQVVGHAASPYARGAALEDTHSDQLCRQNSLHGPDGLRSQ